MNEIIVTLSPDLTRALILCMRDGMTLHPTDAASVSEALSKAYYAWLATQITAPSVPAANTPAPAYHPDNSLSPTARTVKTWLQKGDWPDTYVSGGKKGGATMKEIAIGVGLASESVKSAVNYLDSQGLLKTGGEKAGKWYRLK